MSSTLPLDPQFLDALSRPEEDLTPAQAVNFVTQLHGFWSAVWEQAMLQEGVVGTVLPLSENPEWEMPASLSDAIASESWGCVIELSEDLELAAWIQIEDPDAMEDEEEDEEDDAEGSLQRLGIGFGVYNYDSDTYLTAEDMDLQGWAGDEEDDFIRFEGLPELDPTREVLDVAPLVRAARAVLQALGRMASAEAEA